MKINTLVFALLYLIIFGYSQEYSEYDVLKVGDANPIREIIAIDGTKIELSNKIVWLTFFATYCPPCKAELPELQKVWNKQKERKDFVLIIIGREETKESLQEFRDKNGYTLIFAADTDRKIYDQFAKGYIPRNYLISRDGKIVFHKIGYDRKEKLSKFTQELRRQIFLNKKDNENSTNETNLENLNAEE